MRSMLFAALTVLAICTASGPGFAQHEVKPPDRAGYSFTATTPPLLRHLGGNIIDVPDEARSQVLGETAWTIEQHIPPTSSSKTVNKWGLGGFRPITITRTTPAKDVETHYNLKRIRRWLIAEAPHHYATSETLEVSRVVGYKRTELKSFEDTLGTEAGLSAGPAGGLSASAKAELKITSSVTQEWQQENTMKSTKSYAANTTYVAWKLVDSLILDKTVKVTSNGKSTSTTANSVLNIVVAIYEDQQEDPNKAILHSLRKHD